MTTTETKHKLSPSFGASGNCPGCPRCQDSNAKLCSILHKDYAPYHPLCKVCKHCVLRGTHDDDISDLRNEKLDRDMSERFSKN